MENQPLKHMSLGDRLYNRIKSRFVGTVDPKHLLPCLSLNIPDEEEVEACQRNEGRQNAAALLLRKICCRCPDWFDHLLTALRNPSVGLCFLAEEFEKIRGEVLVVVNASQITAVDRTGNHINLSSEEPMEIDSDYLPTQQQMPSLVQQAPSAQSEMTYQIHHSVSPPTPEAMDRDTYNRYWMTAIKESLNIIFRDLAQHPEQIVVMLQPLSQICQVIFSGAQHGCLELLLRVDNFSSLQIFKEYYKGGALKDALEIEMSPVLLKELNTAINVYGLEVKSLNIQVSVKAEEFAECARHLKSVQVSTPRRSFLEAAAYPLSCDSSMHCDSLESQHTWPPVYQNLRRDALLLTDDPLRSMPEIVKCSEVVDLVKHVIQFIEEHFKLEGELLKDMQSILCAMAVHQKHHVRIYSLEGVTRLDVTTQLNTDLQYLLEMGILKQISGEGNAYTFSYPLLLDYVASTSSDFLEKCLHMSFDYRNIFYAYKCLSQDDTDFVSFTTFLSKSFPFLQLELVPLAVSWNKQYSSKLGMEFVRYVLKFHILDLCDEQVVQAMMHYKKYFKMLHSLQVKICSADTAKTVSDAVEELIKVSPKQYVRVPAKVSVTEFDAVLKVLSLLDLGPNAKEDKEKETNFQSNQILYFNKTGDQADTCPSFHFDFSYLSLGTENFNKLCQYMPCMQHVNRYNLNHTNLNRKRALKLISLMDPAVVKGISLSHCYLDMSSGPLGLSRLPKLQYVDLEKTGMEDAGLHAFEEDLKGLHNLKELNVGCNNISFVGLLQLLLMLSDKNLFALRLHGNQFGQTAGPVIGVLLSRMPNLEVLSVWGCDLQDEGLAHLATFFPLHPRLKRLSLRDNNIRGSTSIKIFENLAKCHLLQFLDYNNNSLVSSEKGVEPEAVSKAVLKTLTGSECWDYLNFWNCSISQLAIFDDATQLKSLHTVTRLCLQTNQIDDLMVKKLSAYFQDSKYLHHLNLRDNQITDSGAVLLASALAGHRHLQDLWVDWNMIGYTGADMLIELALNLPHLKDCNLSFSYQLAPPEKHQLLSKADQVVVHDELFEARYNKLVILL